MTLFRHAVLLVNVSNFWDSPISIVEYANRIRDWKAATNRSLQETFT